MSASARALGHVVTEPGDRSEGEAPGFALSDGASTVDTARRVLRTESEALRLLADDLPEDFDRVVELLLRTQGRVIVSGMGKSGHVSRKIAATLSSTGTPSHFVHPAEASHGDLGAVSEGDACILVSNSGETAELSDLIAHTRRLGIPLVGVGSRRESTLMNAADLRLVLPPAPEACPMGLAPTTSTTMTLALGDALAVALMERRGFMPENFHSFHPGGRLGARLAKVGQIMRGPGSLPLVGPDTPMTETILVMTNKGLGVAGVVAEGRLVGIVTDGDLRRNMEGLMGKLTREVATWSPLTAPPGMLAAEAVALMNQRKVNVLFVVNEDSVPVGVLHIHDGLQAGVA
ncbi:Arabinose 5-phosphate isomerase [Rubellimicrobium mesophilum DSM 19309]|uniref:Arabinose 5-phosphate isomerase n=1 Tax=Rubellimicrobium mesophilum DSM 19309 TaxID=442562 RepID=A0A017HSI6_9RHOB|nr:KpsF/GutQ family sugar-phosphate isomerase [Rubellimicrobium mesophilum]EYD76719.1 Arabinose 5-phosphate isomerase [Rubellimicrobium mesophilum DSM 19309]